MIFVNCAVFLCQHNYVNRVSGLTGLFIIFDYIPISSGDMQLNTTKCGFVQKYIPSSPTGKLGLLVGEFAQPLVPPFSTISFVPFPACEKHR